MKRLNYVNRILGGIFLMATLLSGCARASLPPPRLETGLGERKIFDYQGLKINYYEMGQGKPVLLLHGFGGCSYTWRFLGPALAQDHRVITLDLKGYGLSDKPRDEKYALSDQADLVAAFIQAQGLRDLVIIGHSMGGGVTLMAYFNVRDKDPDWIKRLVLIDSAGYPQKMPWFIRLSRLPGVNILLTRLLSPRFATTLVLKKCYYDKDKITPEQIDAYTYYGSLPGSREAILQTAQQIIPPDMDAFIARYKTINIPVLIVWGEEDEVVPLEVGRNFQRDITASELAIVPQCGHIPPEEEPQTTIHLITTFLEKH
jgi:pimeloyl-ACP methyl ester carboxylesterase